jgi:hypothetical protein
MQSSAIALLGAAAVLVTTTLSAQRGRELRQRSVPPGAEQLVNDRLGLQRNTVAHVKFQSTIGVAQTIHLPLGDDHVSLDLVPRSQRSPQHYRVLAQHDDGALHEATPGPVRTLRGTVRGRPGSRVAASILDHGLHARIEMPHGHTWWVQPVGHMLPDGHSRWHAVYHADDVLPHGKSCANQSARFEDIQAESLRTTLGSCGAQCVAELAVDADHDYFNDYGSIAATEARVNSIINTVNLQYESQVAITHQITTIIVRNVSDSYTSTDPDGRLCQFITEWVNNHSGIQRDLAHLFTGANIDDPVIGIAADIGGSGVCFNGGSCSGGPFGPLGSFCLSQTDFNGSFGCATDLVAHEMGHLWGAFHCSCPSNTMNSGITCSNSFSSGSIGSISSYRDSRTCLSGSGTPVCGNGVVEIGEQCEPPNTPSCDANCQLTGNPACGPGAGDCCVVNGSPGCAQTSCCETICDADAFCCDSTWDQLCADAAASSPNCTCGGTTHDDCSSAAAIFDGNTPFNTATATTDGATHTSCEFDGQTYHDLWYDYVATCTGALTVSMCTEEGGDAQYDTDLVVYDGGSSDCAALSCPPGDGDLLGCSDDAPACSATGTTFASRVSDISVTDGQCYRVRIGGFTDGSTGTGDVNITCIPEGCTPPDCDDSNSCTLDACVSGSCMYTPVAGSCNDNDMCTISDTCSGGDCTGTPVDCSSAGGDCLSATCNASGAEGNCDTVAPTNEGGPCAGGNGVCNNGSCIVDASARRALLAPAGQEEIAHHGSSNAMTMMPGQTSTIEAWLFNSNNAGVGGYQLGLPASATRLSGTGTLNYHDAVPGSVAINIEHPAWLYLNSPDVTTFVSETGLPIGFALLAALPVGSEQVVESSAYFGQFALEASADACGQFSLAFLPDGAPPNGGSSILDVTGVQPVEVYFQPLDIMVGAPNDACDSATPLLGNTLTVPFDTTCATLDGSAHACGTIEHDIWWDYTATCSGTLTVSTTACGFDTTLALYDGNPACPPGDAALIQCADAAGVCESASTPVALGDHVLIRVGSATAASGPGTLTVDCAPAPNPTRVFLARVGAEDGAPASGPTTMTLAAGQTAQVEVWAANTTPATLGGYQIALPAVAIDNGAFGTVTYVLGSVEIDSGDSDWVFGNETPTAFTSETGLPDGFALLATLDLGQGVLVTAPVYLGAFALKASSTASGTFAVNFLPDGAPPNGGSSLVDQTGNTPIEALYQPLHVTVQAAQPCLNAANCGDGDSNGITDDACTWFSCDASLCNSQPRIFADAGGSFGACEIDGFSNIHDKNHILTCFSGSNTCDTFNMDIGGPFGDCDPDGFCNVHDANHTLQAFSGISTCSCPLDGGGPMPEFPTPVIGHATLSAVTTSRRVRPGDVVEVDIMVAGPIERLQSYQLEVFALGGRVMLELQTVRVDDRPDTVFSNRSDVFMATNASSGQMLRGLDAQVGIHLSDRAYLATYVYEVPRHAAGRYRIGVQGHGQTYLVGGQHGAIEIDSVNDVEIHVVPTR